jgi:hypothetical protein
MLIVYMLGKMYSHMPHETQQDTLDGDQATGKPLASQGDKQEVTGRTNRLISFDTTRTAQKTKIWGWG